MIISYSRSKTTLIMFRRQIPTVSKEVFISKHGGEQRKE